MVRHCCSVPASVLATDVFFFAFSSSGLFGTLFILVVLSFPSTTDSFGLATVAPSVAQGATPTTCLGRNAHEEEVSSRARAVCIASRVRAIFQNGHLHWAASFPAAQRSGCWFHNNCEPRWLEQSGIQVMPQVFSCSVLSFFFHTQLGNNI